MLFCICAILYNFYPRPPRGGRRLASPSPPSAAGYFYPRPPRGGRHVLLFQQILLQGYFYPRPPRGGRHVVLLAEDFQLVISIHALREEGDGLNINLVGRIDISIHALREEGDVCVSWQSRQSYKNFYPRPPRGGRLFHGACNVILCNFYPRPPRGGRPLPGISWPCSMSFLSTPSARRATGASGCEHHDCSRFLSTPSARRATTITKVFRYCYPISIHALREEGDRKRWLSVQQRKRFLSTPSARRATLLQGFQHPHIPISIHALREEGDEGCFPFLVLDDQISIHALREEGDPISAGTKPR